MRHSRELRGRGQPLRASNARKESRNVVESNRVGIVRGDIHRWSVFILPKVEPLPSPNRLCVPDDTPVSFYTMPKVSIGELSSTPSPHGLSGTIQNYAFHEELEQNPSQGNMSYMTTFTPTTSESFRSKSPYQTVSSSDIPSPGAKTYTEPEMDPKELSFSPLTQAPTNTPDGISNYDYLGAPNLDGERWNQNQTLTMNSAMVNFQSFDQSYFVPVMMQTQTENSQSFNVSGSPAFHPITRNNGMTSFDNTPDMSFSSETPVNQNQNRGYGTADEYSGSFY
ncbi:hypothetical protein NHQ30_010811 [Ciborinia camelliae]|nr:hypothetical protein NHQ30_010811 [Ciborinia camelliae]